MLGRSLRRPLGHFDREYKGSVSVVAVTWLVLLGAGLGGFILVRDSVVDQRREMMRERRFAMMEINEKHKDMLVQTEHETPVHSPVLPPSMRK